MLSVSVKTCFKKPFAVEEIFRRWKAFLSLYGQYKPLDEEMSRLITVNHCAGIAMKGEQKRTNEEQQLMP